MCTVGVPPGTGKHCEWGMRRTTVKFMKKKSTEISSLFDVVPVKKKKKKVCASLQTDNLFYNFIDHVTS